MKPGVIGSNRQSARILRRNRLLVWVCLGIALLDEFSSARVVSADDPIRVGIVGCDTSHVIAFTNLINHPESAGALADVEVVAAYPGGSPDMPASRDRLPGFVTQLKKKNVAIVDDLDELAERCDAFLLESVDGRTHLQQFRQIARGKPVFIDKPAAASLTDVIAIFQVADATKTPVFSSSALRFVDAVRELVKNNSTGTAIGCETVGPLSIDSTHPDLFWYGIHGIEPLFAILGRGCEAVTRVDSDKSVLVVGNWSGGRLGAYRGLKNSKANYAFTVYDTDRIVHRAVTSGYDGAVREICKFFKTRKPPVSREETIEIFAFMEAADESKRRGTVVPLSEMIERAENELAKRQQSAGAGE